MFKSLSRLTKGSKIIWYSNFNKFVIIFSIHRKGDCNYFYIFLYTFQVGGSKQ